VLFVRYELLPDVWAEVAEYVGLAASHPPMPTRERRSDRRAIGSPMKEQLDALYGELAAQIGTLSPTHLAPGRTPRP
jgi:hypothetical protein